MSTITIKTQKFNLEINHEEDLENFSKLLTSNSRKLNFKLSMDSIQYEGVGVRGDDAVWVPYSEDYGLKIYTENEKYSSLSDSLVTIEKIKEEECFLFPEILEFGMIKDEVSNRDFVFIIMENVKQESFDNSVRLGFVPSSDRRIVSENLVSDIRTTPKVSEIFKELELNPEDEWYKSINCIAGKIVDFHRFTVKDERYYMPSNGLTPMNLQQQYMNMVNRYKTVLDSSGLPKWKGKIYQGFVFDNGYTMKGYSSSPREYDSYKKMPFIPLNKSSGKKVLDLGSNQGFFCFQASLHGATEVTGVELQVQDHLAALDLKEIMKLENVNFLNTDAVKFMEDTVDHYGLIIMNSVLHQIYKNFEGSEIFMENISKKCDYFAFETPLNHPLMNISAGDVQRNLLKYFKNVRLINVYDAYSSGYRANYVCF